MRLRCNFHLSQGSFRLAVATVAGIGNLRRFLRRFAAVFCWIGLKVAVAE